MTLKHCARYTTLVLVSAACLSAAPRLRLSTTTVGPVNIVPGSNGPLETVQAANLGDGSLSLSTTASVSWLSVNVGSSAACATGHCTPVAISLNTSSLKAGTYTGIVTISDPAATDAPQTITVTVAVGGDVPAQVNLYTAPGGSADVTFSTDHPVNSAVSTQSGGGWLTLSLNGQGTFVFAVPYKITAKAPSGVTSGSYTGAVKLSGSQSALDNKTVNVTLNVTTNPIIDIGNVSLNFTVGQGMPAESQYVNTLNDGQGTLSVSDTKITVDTGSWLSAKPIGGTPLVQVTADPTGLSPGTHTGTVTIDSNAANGSVVVPVELDVLAQAGPAISIPGVINPANYVNEPLAQGDIALVKGTWLHNGDAVLAPSAPLPTKLGSDNVQVLVNGNPTPLFYVAFSQINFQIPYETPVGDATVQVVANGKTSNTETIQVLASAPRILQFCYASNYCPAVWGIGLNTDNTFPIVGTDPTITAPRAKHPAHAGDTLVFYAVGLGQTNPAQTTGAAPAAAAKTASYQVCFSAYAGSLLSNGGVCTTAAYAGVTPGNVGLYQINVKIPANAPTGDLIQMTIENANSASDPVMLSIQ